LDASASMGFGSGAVTKFRYGQFLAASLAYLSDRQNDAIGCVVFNDDVQQFVKPSSNSSQLQTLLRVLDEAVVEAGTEFSRPSETFRQVVTKKGIVAVISDFYCDPGPVLEELKAFAWQGQDLILFQILDDDEFQPGFENNVLLRDLETGEAVEVDPSFLKESYPGRLQQHIQNISQNAAAMGAEHVLVKTSDSLDKAMRQYLLTRERRS
ncbi:MAG: VWA domain-containing protein, partial [Pseudomonadota bacterium]